MRNQAVGLLEQEAKRDPPTPVPFVEANVETILDKASCPVQLRPGTGIVSKLVERHGQDGQVMDRGDGDIRAGIKAVPAPVHSFGVIAAPVFKKPKAHEIPTRTFWVSDRTRGSHCAA